MQKDTTLFFFLGSYAVTKILSSRSVKMFYFMKDISFSVLLLVSIALKILPLAEATQKSRPFFQSRVQRFFFAGSGEGKRMT